MRLVSPFRTALPHVPLLLLLLLVAAQPSSPPPPPPPPPNATGACAVPRLQNATKAALNLALGAARATIDEQWPLICNASHLDPLNVTSLSGSVTKLDHKDGCDEICGAQLASCHAFELRVGKLKLSGLDSVNITAIELMSLRIVDANETCNATAPATPQVLCGLNGQANLSATLSLKVALDLEDSGGGIRVTCKDAFKKWTELLWKGHGHCTASTDSLQMHVATCGSCCNPLHSKDLVAIESAAVSSLDFNFKHFDCDFDAGKGIPHLPDIAKFFSPHLFQSIATALQPTMASLMTAELGRVLPAVGMPTACAPRRAE